MFRKRRSSSGSRFSRFLGPCVGEVTANSAKLWIHTPLLEGAASREIIFTLHDRLRGPVLQTHTARLTPERLGSGTVCFQGLKADTRYHYRVWNEDGRALKLPDLQPEHLWFRTFPAEGTVDKFDFLLMSCHDPTQVTDDGHDGYAVWAAMDQIRQNNDVRFAILSGDQIYGDHVQEKVLAADSRRRRLELYLGVYEKLWSHPCYRRTLCSLPAFLMWDDHDITDGWGSRSDSFIDAESSEFRPEWKALFASAREAFVAMQAIRNPAPLIQGPSAGFDYCFKVGKAGFAMIDLRSQRNVRKHQMWSGEQFAAVRRWVAGHRQSLDSLFVVSPVVFTHGWPNAEKAIRKLSPFSTALSQALGHLPLVSQLRPVDRFVKRNFSDLGGFRDDLEDAWASDPNNAQAEEMLDFLFELQNPRDGAKPLPVILLSGDIHAAGYSMVYSYKPEHSERPVIEHICSSPVGSKPMHWMIEAMYSQQVKKVPIGTSGKYCGQVSHHHSHRNVVVLSVRRPAKGELQLKAKYYLEGRPQPEIIVSDLNRVSRAESIQWGKETAESPEIAAEVVKSA